MSNMHKNITISDLNVEIQSQGNSFKKHVLAKIGICLIEFLLSSVLYCYGIILSEYVLIGSQKYVAGIYATILYVCCLNFTDPLARFMSEYFDDRKNVFFRCIVGCNTLVLFVGVMIPTNINYYMIFGGITNSIISTQLTYLALDKLDMDSKVFEAYRQVARAISLFIMPHFVFWLTSNYEINQTKLIFSSVLLNIIPAALIVRGNNHWDNEHLPEMSRYQTIGRVTYQMNDIKNHHKQNAETMDPESSSSEEEIENTIYEIPSPRVETDLYDNEPQLLQVQLSQIVPVFNSQYNYANASPSSSGHEFTFENYGSPEYMESQMYVKPMGAKSVYSNISSLPGIPEENEELNDSDNDINVIHSKRLSKISDKLEELNIQDQIRRGSAKEVFSINAITKEHKAEPINTIEYIANFKENKNRSSVLEELKALNTKARWFHFSPYKKYIWTRRLRMLKDFIHDNFARPMYHALKNMYFYPSLTSKVVTNLISSLYITLAPFIAMQKSWKQSLIFSTENATFLLTYIAFSWCFFLVSLPLVIKLSHRKIRMLYGLGLIISGFSFWLLSGKLSNDVITFGSLLFGCGYGIISYTEKIVFKSSIGMRPWYLVRGPLEVLSAIFILLIYYLIYTYNFDLNFLLLLSALSYLFNAFLWLFLPFVKYFISILKRIIFDERSQQEGFFN